MSVRHLSTRWHSDTAVKQPKLSRCYSNLKVSFSLSAHSLLFERSSFASRGQSDVTFMLLNHNRGLRQGVWSWSLSQFGWCSNFPTVTKVSSVTWRRARWEEGHTNVCSVIFCARIIGLLCEFTSGVKNISHGNNLSEFSCHAERHRVSVCHSDARLGPASQLMKGWIKCQCDREHTRTDPYFY